MREYILALILQTGVGQPTLKYVSDKMTLQDCERAAKTFQAKSPSGGDAEVSIAVVCAKGKLEYQK